MASHALVPEAEWTVLDACAAPGNKTTHVAALMKKSGRIIALDIHQERFQMLLKTIKQSGANNIMCKRVSNLVPVGLQCLWSTGGFLAD